MSWHISSVVSRCHPSQELSVISYVHLFDTSTQDWFAVTSIIENLLLHIKAANPRIKNAYLRSDEAGCYHNNMLVAAIKDIGDRVGIQIKRYDFSEPQQGKDICDRIICPLKSAIRAYCNEGNDVVTALQMQEALIQHPVKGTICSVNKVNDSVSSLDTKKIKNISAYHNFQYDSSGITVWKGYGVGQGKKLTNKSIFKTHQQPTNMIVSQSFVGGTDTARTLKMQTEVPQPDKEDSSKLECTEHGCNFVCNSFDELEQHMGLGEHSRFVNNESIYDVIRREWAKKFTTIDRDISEMKNPGTVQTGATNLTMGWALSKSRTGSKRFSTHVRDYMVAIFDCGEKNGNKADPASVALEMRNAKMEDGSRRFAREEWLNKSQIKSFFSRLAKLRRSGKSSESIPLEADSDHGDSDSEDDQEEEHRQDLLKEISVSLATSHPIAYQDYNLCNLTEKGQLKDLKVKMLKEICSHFELPVKSRDTKAILTERIMDMVGRCSCSIK